MKLLIVDDNADDVELIVAELRRFGFDPDYVQVYALDIVEAAIRNEPWSAVISDYHLPGFTGMDVLLAVRKHDREVPFIVVSGNLGEERAVDLIRAGANDYIIKDRLARLGSAVEREIRDVQLRQERRMLFDAFRRSEDRYRRIFEKAPIGVVNTTADGIVLAVNERFARMLGYEREVLAGLRLEQLIHPDDVTLTSTTGRFRQRYLRADSEVVWASVTAALIAGDDMAVEQVVWLVEDITAQRAAQEKLSLQALLLDAVDQAVVATDIRGNLTYWNRFASELYGWSGEEAAGRNLTTLSRSETANDELSGLLQQAAEGHGWSGEIVLHKRDGTAFPSWIISSPLVDAAGRISGLVGVSYDITERKQQELELERRAEQQTVVANLGQAALRGEPMELLVERTTEIITNLLNVDISGILQLENGRFRWVGARGWDETVNSGDEIDAGWPSLALHTLEQGEPVVVTDLTTDSRFPLPAILAANGVASSLTVPISTGRVAAWGVLGAMSRRPRQFTTLDVDFLRAVATVLAQAAERDRVEQQLVQHAAQQSAIAELSRIALRSVDKAVDTACNIVTDVLHVAHAVVFLLDADRLLLRYRAGRCWMPAEQMNFPLDGGSAIAAALLRDEPVRLEAADAAGDGIAVPVTSSNARFGVLTARTHGERPLLEADLEFMQSVANILADAMERERASQALSASQERYREVVEGASEVIFTVSADGRFLSLNNAFEQTTGWTVAEWLGRPLLGLVHPEDTTLVHAVMARLIDERHPASAEIRVMGCEGDVLLDVNCFPKVENGKTSTVFGFARDITAARRAEEERRKLEGKLEQAGRLTSLGRMAATIAHEFNNVLMGISPFVEVIRRGRNIEASLDHIGRAVKRGKRITEDILRFTRPAQPQRTGFDVSRWIDDIALEGRSLVPAGCYIETEVLSRNLTVNGDPNQLQQVFSNLILNARDAMPGGGTLSISVVREAADARLPFALSGRPDTFAHFTVRDTGSGMSEETLRHIFEPLFTTKTNGTGLGLPVAHQVVQLHGGEMFVESRLHFGTTFHIFLPLADSGAVAPEVEEALPPIAGRHVLLVEDDRTVATGLVAVLEMEGLRVDVVETGADAIRALDRIQPDVVVLDVGLPDMDGTAVYDAIAAKMPNLPVIFSTGHADRAMLDSVLALPNVGYLLKPYQSNILLRAIEDVLPSDVETPTGRVR
jgi:two-component system cell cycle sensor histidine kinase/response regulator CckA